MLIEFGFFFRKRKNEIKEAYERTKLLTVEQSIELRLQIKNQIETYEKLTSDKDKEIQVLKSEVESLNRRGKTTEEKTYPRSIKTDELSESLVELLELIERKTITSTKEVNEDVKQLLNQLIADGYLSISSDERIGLTSKGKHTLNNSLSKQQKINQELLKKYREDPDFIYFSNKYDLRKLLLDLYSKGRIYPDSLSKSDFSFIEELDSMNLLISNNNEQNYVNFYSVNSRGIEFLKASNLIPKGVPRSK